MSDLISRQAAIDILAIGDALLSRALDDMYVVGVERAKYEWGLGLIDSYIEDFKELPSVNQWIPCSERLPEGGRVVLVTEKGGFIRHCEYANYCDFQEFQTVEEGLTVHDVIAWMPLPDPWKEKPNEIH